MKEIEKKIHDIIYAWVEDNFGESEANDPSWNIESLAHEISKANNILSIYKMIERNYLKHDLEDIIEERDIKLTEEEKQTTINLFMDSDRYTQRPTEDWLWFIREVKEGEQ